MIYLNNGEIKENPLFHSVKQGCFYSQKEQGKMRAAVFMSGAGSNFKKIYNLESTLKEKTPFEIVAVVTDTKNGYENGKKIIQKGTGKKNTIPIIYINPKEVIQNNSKYSKEEKRILYDKKVIDELEKYQPNFGILAGFMRVLSQQIIKRIPCINVHPSPLKIVDPLTGQRKFTGSNAVKEQILSGEKYLKSSVHIVREGIDTGEILIQSDKVEIDLEDNEICNLKNNPALLEEIIEKNQNMLKEQGDHIIFPIAVLSTALGLYRFDKFGKLFYALNKTSPENEKISYFKEILEKNGILPKYL